MHGSLRVPFIIVSNKISRCPHPRVDIHRKDNPHSLKKPITVFGDTEMCSRAIAMILQIMQEERVTLSKVILEDL